MNATVAGLLSAAVRLREEYGWSSANLLQRRLRVTRQLASYLFEETDGPKAAT